MVYDSTVHGSFDLIRDRTNQQFGTLANLGEKKWIADYVKTRRDWLANHTRDDLRATVYRMDAIQRLIDLNLWDLQLPLLVRGHEISELTLNAEPTRSYDAPQPGSRALALQTPLARGLDVRLVQLGLSKAGIDVLADGVFGNGSVAAVKAYQTKNNLQVTGALDTASVIQVVG